MAGIFGKFQGRRKRFTKKGKGSKSMVKKDHKTIKTILKHHPLNKEKFLYFNAHTSAGIGAFGATLINSGAYYVYLNSGLENQTAEYATGNSSNTQRLGQEIIMNRANIRFTLAWPVNLVQPATCNVRCVLIYWKTCNKVTYTDTASGEPYGIFALATAQQDTQRNYTLTDQSQFHVLYDRTFNLQNEVVNGISTEYASATGTPGRHHVIINKKLGKRAMYTAANYNTNPPVGVDLLEGQLILAFYTDFASGDGPEVGGSSLITFNDIV